MYVACGSERSKTSISLALAKPAEESQCPPVADLRGRRTQEIKAFHQCGFGEAGGGVAVPAGGADGVDGDEHARAGDLAGGDGVAQADIDVIAGPHIDRKSTR